MSQNLLQSSVLTTDMLSPQGRDDDFYLFGVWPDNMYIMGSPHSKHKVDEKPVHEIIPFAIELRNW